MKKKHKFLLPSDPNQSLFNWWIVYFSSKYDYRQNHAKTYYSRDFNFERQDYQIGKYHKLDEYNNYPRFYEYLGKMKGKIKIAWLCSNRKTDDMGKRVILEKHYFDLTEKDYISEKLYPELYSGKPLYISEHSFPALWDKKFHDKLPIDKRQDYYTHLRDVCGLVPYFLENRSGNSSGRAVSLIDFRKPEQLPIHD